MKKAIYPVLCFLLLASAAAAQTTNDPGFSADAGKVRFGVRLDGGIYVQALSGNGLSETSTGPTFGGGVTANYHLPNRPNLYVGGGLGVRYTPSKDDAMGYEATSKLTQVYLDMTFGGLNPTFKRFGIGTGLRLCFPVGFTLEQEGMDSQDMKDFCNAVQLGILIDPYFQFGNMKVGADIALMMSNLYKNEGAYSDYSSPSASITFFVAYRF